MNDTEKIIFLLIGFGIGLLIGFLSWHPNNNDYVDRDDYNELYQKYQDLQIEQEKLKKDMGQLILEYYGRSLVLDSFGLRKYRLTFCALQEYIVGEIPIVGELIC